MDTIRKDGEKVKCSLFWEGVLDDLSYQVSRRHVFAGHKLNLDRYYRKTRTTKIAHPNLSNGIIHYIHIGTFNAT